MNFKSHLLAPTMLLLAISLELNSAENKLEDDDVRLVVLGTSAGRTSWRGSPTGGFSAAVEVGSNVYLIDFGRNWLDRYFEAGLGSPGNANSSGGLNTLKAAFITHLHADHIVDFPRLILFGSSDGAARQDKPISIFGPGTRGQLPESSEYISNPAEIVNPQNPSPGTVDMFYSLMAAFATDLNDNILDGGKPNPTDFLNVQDIRIPVEVDASANNVAPIMEPFQIYQDAHVVVSAILVSHAPIYPAFAYRIDTDQGSIVFSGDTGPHPNLITLAQGADLLVHEAQDSAWVDNRFPEPRNDADAAKRRHLLESHTDLRVLGDIAQEAEVGELILAHNGPSTLDQEDVDSHVEGFGGAVTLAQPLMEWRLSRKD